MMSIGSTSPFPSATPSSVVCDWFGAVVGQGLVGNMGESARLGDE